MGERVSLRISVEKTEDTMCIQQALRLNTKLDNTTQKSNQNAFQGLKV